MSDVDNWKIVLRLTRSQQMALLDVIMASMRCPNKESHATTFINCSTPLPCEETTIGELLNLVSDMSEQELG